MARVIPDELKNFKNALDGKTSGMNASASDIASKIENLTSTINSTQSDVAAAYKPATGENQAVAKLESTSMIMKDMASDITATISSAVAAADGIIAKVIEMENLLIDIEAQQGIIKKEKGKEKPNTGAISAANAKIQEDESKFDTDLSDAQGSLASLKGMDKSTNVTGSNSAGETVSVGQLGEYTKYLNQLKFGTFTKESFTSSNNIKIDYYLYKPDYGCEVKGLPTLMYMTGASMTGTGEHICIDNGLGQMLAEKRVTPSGLICIPHVSDGYKYENAEYRKALAELPVAVCKANNGDPNRISLAGVSYGAVVSYLLVNENPGTFSAIGAACGANEVTSAFKDVKCWNFNGRSNDGNHTTRNYVAKQTDAVKAAGGWAKYDLNDEQWAHTNVGNWTFQNQHEDENGEMVWVHEWLFKQTREEKVTA